jgi:hypothetical protein
MSRFAEDLSAGQLTFASNLAVQKHHVVRLSSSAFDEDVDALSKTLSKATRTAISKIDSERRGLWSAVALCGVRGEQVTFGNRHRYYWRPLRNPSLETMCQGCLRAWRKIDEPEITGWDRSASPQDAWPWELPFGWQDVPVEGHPWDVPADKSIESVKDKTGAVVGEHRVELQRWRRGDRIVRLVHHVALDTYAARYWQVGAEPDAERQAILGTLQHARQGCQKLMARGGY